MKHDVSFKLFTFSWVGANEFTFFRDQMTFNSTQRYQVDGAFLGTLVIDPEADVTSLRQKLPSE
jgi:acyl CoA:acetate/3-ketoacid CoA transferase beta subunit